MDKKPLIMVSLCAVVLLILDSQSVIRASKDDDLINVTTQVEGIKIDSGKVSNVTSFHSNISGARYWYSIKANFFDLTNITIEYVNHYSSNGSSKIFFFDLINSSDYYSYLLEWTTNGASPNYYLQFHFSCLNWSYYHDQNNVIGWGVTHRTTTLNNITGTWFFTFVSYMTESMLNVWINASGNASFSVTTGNEVFAYDRHDFFGIMNMGWKRGTIIINGAMKINIKNQLFALFNTGSVSTGFETLKYKSPTGDYEWKYFRDKKGEHTYINQSENFLKGLRWGTNGTWIFYVNMLNIGIRTCCPNIYLLGADIKLPE